MASTIPYVLLATFCLGLLTFAVTYLKSNWREYIVGRYIMYFWLTLFVVFVYLLFGSVLGNYPGRIFVDTFLLLAMNYGAWKLVWLLRTVQNGKDNNDKRENIRP